MPDRLDRMLDLVRQHRPRLTLVDRNTVPWMRWFGLLASPVAPDLNTRFTTVLGDTVYLPGPPERFPRDGLAATLAHELVHQLDQARWGPMFYVSYVAAGPALRTRRAHWERRAYAVDLLLAFEAGGDAALERTADRLADVFAGPSYAWMWAGRASARSYLEPVVAAVRDGSLAQQAPYDSLLAAWRGPDPEDSP
jgi:hypothetical protein